MEAWKKGSRIFLGGMCMVLWVTMLIATILSTAVGCFVLALFLSGAAGTPTQPIDPWQGVLFFVLFLAIPVVCGGLAWLFYRFARSPLPALTI
jgi:hypothetical protein